MSDIFKLKADLINSVFENVHNCNNLNTMNIWLLFLSAAHIRKYWVRELRGGWSFMPITYQAAASRNQILRNWSIFLLERLQTYPKDDHYKIHHPAQQISRHRQMLLKCRTWDLPESKVTGLSCRYAKDLLMSTFLANHNIRKKSAALC